MSKYPVASNEELIAIVASAHEKLARLQALKNNAEGYAETMATYKKKIDETQVEIEAVMAELSAVSDQYVTAYLGKNPKDEEAAEETPAEPPTTP